MCIYTYIHHVVLVVNVNLHPFDFFLSLHPVSGDCTPKHAGNHFNFFRIRSNKVYF